MGRNRPLKKAINLTKTVRRRPTKIWKGQ